LSETKSRRAGIDVPGLLVVAGVDFDEDLPLFAVVVAPGVGACLGVDLLYASAKGVVGVFSHVGIGAVPDPNDAVLYCLLIFSTVLAKQPDRFPPSPLFGYVQSGFS